MSTMMWLAVAVAVVLALAVGYVLLRQRRQGLRGRFGPGYEHSLTEREDRAEAEHELRSREKRFATLDITPLAPASRQTYARQWATLQERFVDAPGPAVTAADELVTTVMAERGYPTEDFRQQLADLSVVHGRTLYHYRQAHEIRQTRRPGRVLHRGPAAGHGPLPRPVRGTPRRRRRASPSTGRSPREGTSTHRRLPAEVTRHGPPQRPRTV